MAARAIDMLLDGGMGNDTINGGGSIDTITYAAGTATITVSLSNGAAQAVGGGQGADTISNVESLIGSGFGDVITGSATSGGTLYGMAGNDTITSNTSDRSPR